MTNLAPFFMASSATDWVRSIVSKTLIGDVGCVASSTLESKSKPVLSQDLSAKAVG